MENCTISRNYSGFGGAMYCLLSSPKLSNCTFIKNQGTWAGGAIYSDKSTPILNNCVFNDNSTNSNGGGMFNEASTPKLSNCTFNSNSASTGGGIYCEPGCEPIIISGKIAQNYADYGGGIYVAECINVKVTNCFIIQNMAILGAGIYSNDAVLTIKQNVISENIAQYGGAVFCEAQPDGKLVMDDCTLADNSAILGRSIACDSFFGSSTVKVTNSILYNGGSEILNNDKSKIDITYSDIQGGWPGKNNIDADPLFIGSTVGDFHLLTGSPCIDAGDLQYVPQLNEMDLDGNPRLIGRAIDIGAFEAQPLIELSVDRFEFDAAEGFPNPDDQILIVRNAGAGTLNWQVSYNCNWLKVEPNSGSSQRQGNTAWLKVDATGLTEGQYDCQLTVLAPIAINSPQTVYVTLFVHKNCFPDTPEYAKQYADFLEYAAYGADPSCWCASPFDGTHYQCDGDTSGKKQKFTEYRIFTDDLVPIIKNWKKKIDMADPCADINHKAHPFFQYRVFANDLAILIKNWKKRDNELPNDCPRPDGQ
jgi:predicted outer membrane repeat protein